MFFNCGESILHLNHYTCSCKKYRVYHSYYFDEQVLTEEVAEILGIYEKFESSKNDLGVMSFKHQSKDLYLFSVHPKRRVWSIGHGFTITDTEVSSIDFELYNENLCPHYGSYNGLRWKVFKQKTEYGQDIWKNSNIYLKIKLQRYPIFFIIVFIEDVVT